MLVFGRFELAGVLLATFIAAHVTNEGETTWFEGLRSWRCTGSWA